MDYFKKNKQVALWLCCAQLYTVLILTECYKNQHLFIYKPSAKICCESMERIRCVPKYLSNNLFDNNACVNVNVFLIILAMRDVAISINIYHCDPEGD